MHFWHDFGTACFAALKSGAKFALISANFQKHIEPCPFAFFSATWLLRGRTKFQVRDFPGDYCGNSRLTYTYALFWTDPLPL